MVKGMLRSVLHGLLLSLGGAPKPRIVLFYMPDMEEVAHKIAAISGGQVQLGRIKWERFPDRFPNVFIEDAVSIRDVHVAFLASLHDPGLILEAMAVVWTLPRLFVASFKLLLPFFPTGTMERVDSEGQVATADTLAHMISATPSSRSGPASVVIFDIHALQNRFYFNDTVMPLLESGVPLLLRRLRQLEDRDRVSIAYPDEGSWKRFHALFKREGYPEIICTKVRDGDRRVVCVKEGEPSGRHVVIVDDLVQSGGTLIECGAVLAARGAVHVSAYVTHAVFPHHSYEKFLHDNGAGAAATKGFRFFWITDSCPATVRAIGARRPPFEVLSLAEPLAAALAV